MRDLTRLRARERRRDPARLLGPRRAGRLAVAGGRPVATGTRVVAVERGEVALGEILRVVEPDWPRIRVPAVVGVAVRGERQRLGSDRRELPQVVADAVARERGRRRREAGGAVGDEVRDQLLMV